MNFTQRKQPALKRVVSPYRRAFAAILVSALFAACGLLWAQTGGTGAISGAVTDSTGAMVAGAEVKVVNVATGETRALRSNDHGLYLASLLAPGQYTVEVTKQGFKTVSLPDVKVIVSETVAVNIGLEPGAVTETITVATSNVQLQTESSELGRVTDSQMISNLPLVSRNYTQIVGLNPGVAQEVNNAANIGRGQGAQAGLPGGGSIMAQGATASDNNFQINGIPVNDMQSSMIYSPGIPIPNPDTIQEFKVSTAQFDATTGRNAGAAVNLVTKSGSNDYHATLWEFFRNEDLNANEWFAKRQGTPRGVLRQNQYGFTAGGPVVKNRVILFGSWQGTKQSNALDAGGHQNVLLPPLTDQRDKATLATLFNGKQGYLGALGGTISGATRNISDQAVTLLNIKLPNGKYLIPTPTTINTSRSFEVSGSAYQSQPSTFSENQWMTNGDYLRSDRHKVNFNYFGANSIQMQPILMSTFGFPLYIPLRFDVGTVADSFTLSPNMVNQLIVGVYRSTFNMNYHNAFNYQTGPVNLGMNVPVKVDAYPFINILNDGFSVGTSSATAFGQNEYNIVDIVSWTKGKHQFTFGGGFGFGRDNMSKFFYPGAIYPLTWADFMLGTGNHFGYSNIYQSNQGLGDFARDWRYKLGHAYIQDNYKIGMRFTLNMGMRYEHLGNLAVAGGKGGNVDLSKVNPDPAVGGSYDGYVVASNYVGPALPTSVRKLNNNFGFNGQNQDVWNPRLGFAWRLPGTERFVLRGGAGTYHTTVTGQLNLQMSASAPYGMWDFKAATANVNATAYQPFTMPEPVYPKFRGYYGDGTVANDTSFTMAAFAMDFRPPTTYHYSLGLQSKLVGGAILDVSYAGARSLHIVMGGSMNQASLASPTNPIRGQTTSTVANLNYRKPYLGWTTSSMYQWSTRNAAWYNALQASLSQQMRHGLQYQASYTWARLLSLVPAFSTGTNTTGPAGDQNNLRAGYGPDQNIRPQRFVLSLIYNLPAPSNAHRILASTLGGWTASTATVIQSGRQVSLAYTNTNSVYGTSVDRPSYASGCTAKDLPTKGTLQDRVTNGYINASCVAAPALIGAPIDPAGTARGFGNTQSGILKTPSQINSDISIGKLQKVSWPKEGASVQFRTDFFNAFNHANFAQPGVTYGAATFGTILGTAGNPRLIQFSLKYAF
jgi:hypothetical protein